MDPTIRADDPSPLRRVSPARQILTIFGDYWWRVDAPLPTGAILAALEDLGVKAPTGRAALARLVERDLLTVSKEGRRTSHRLTERGVAIVADEERWLNDFGVGDDAWDGRWSVVAFSIPETQRGLRHTSRSRLRWLGFTTLYDGVWISPRDAADAALRELRDIGVEDITVMRATLESSEEGAPQSAWPIAEIADRYRDFERTLSSVDATATAAAALCDRSATMLEWQTFREIDPRLPVALLPADWPRARVRRMVGDVLDALGPQAESRMRAHVADVDGALADLVTERRLHIDT